MARVQKQDSNFTELRYAIEDSPGHVPSDAVWFPLEPNSYKTFGGEVKLKARMPINSSRQLKKGVVVDLDASGEWQQDLTQTNFQDLAEFFLWAAKRKKNELSIATVDGTANGYTATSGGDGYYAKDLLFAKGFADDANNGLKVVSGVPTALSVLVTDTGLLTASGQTGTISRVGFEFGAGLVKIDVSGSLPKLKSVTTVVAAFGTLTGDGTNITDGDTVTIGGKVYTFQDTLTDVDGHVLKAGTAAGSLTNLFHAINKSGGTIGTDYATATTAHPTVIATNPSGTTVVVTARNGGAQGNAITTTEVSSHLSWGAATLASGAGARALNSLGLIPGEYVFVGGDSNKFFNAVDNGFCRVRSVAADYIEFDKSQFIMVADDGTDTGSGGSASTIRIFFGRVLKNESDATLILKRSIQIERTLGQPDDSSTDQQAEYLRRSIADTMKLDTKQADIVRAELGFTCNDNELRTAADGLKPGTRPSVEDTDAFNATSDIAFTKLAIVTDGDSCPTPLFSFFTDLVIDLKNNVKQNKAVGTLGAFDSTAGFFQVAATLTGYFIDVDEIQAVRDNDSITLETHFVKFNQGITIDLPLVTLGKALADVKLNEAIMIPLNADAATAKIIDTNLDHTMLWVFWDYLPDLAG